MLRRGATAAAERGFVQVGVSNLLPVSAEDSNSDPGQVCVHTQTYASYLTLTSDLRREVGRVTADEQLQLLMKVAALQVHVPGSDSCREEEKV